jgi:hypothetical protein
VGLDRKNGGLAGVLDSQNDRVLDKEDKDEQFAWDGGLRV